MGGRMRELLASIRSRLNAIFRRKQLEQDIADEIAFHIARREENLHSTGLPDARFAARRRFGNSTRIMEDCRTAWSFTSVERFAADVRVGLRFIRKNRWTV